MEINLLYQIVVKPLRGGMSSCWKKGKKKGGKKRESEEAQLLFLRLVVLPPPVRRPPAIRRECCAQHIALDVPKRQVAAQGRAVSLRRFCVQYNIWCRSFTL
jgi:hypothetical protein